MKVVEIMFYDRDRVKLVVEMPDPNRYSTENAPHIRRSLFKLFPRLAKHRCDNENGYTFSKECRSTEIPHLLEHLIIELQSQVQTTRILRGETQWNWRIDPRGRFHVYVDYENEHLVLGAIRLAERIINGVDSRRIDDIDIDKEVARLATLAEVGNDLSLEDPFAADSDAEPAAVITHTPL